MIKDLLRSSGDEKVDINLSPMIDCVFILLIFFILTTVFLQETGIEVDRPEASGSVPLEQDSIMIGISSDERIFHGGREISLSAVRPLIYRALAAERASVIIQADKSIGLDIFAKVYGEAKTAGADVYFSTDELPLFEQ
ncbi:biopolymer transporter ExbD [Pelagicoccus sp. SDUM812002]|uniref:ExbD/TolR family protein n=1 Tax=Pelagicoccus sp. SDUM812002 TaxID=3041266 RepID=UPI00280DF48E|nr:biopolymer transporter ExbD [Pelagicoccus sp. SDUM812002]MDQ8184797.1 biopolymer transporter ExbD [Pelagicoccus sp. SDUM812002]